MKTKITLAASVIAAVFTCTAFASSVPEKCPNIKSIQAAGLSSVRELMEGWIGEHRSYYDTLQEWGFSVGAFHVDNPADAMSSATASLLTLHKVYGPVEMEKNVWTCVYSDMVRDNGVTGFAETPPQDHTVSLFKKSRK